MLVYYEDTSTVILIDGDVGLLVDVSLCLDACSTGRWITERLSSIMVIGHVESADVNTRLFILSNSESDAFSARKSGGRPADSL